MNKNEAQTLADTINAWNFAYVNAYVTTLGDETHPSVMVTISLDPKGSWNHGILENSRYVKLAFHAHGPNVVQFKHISGFRTPGLKLRAFTAADKSALYKKLTKIHADLKKAQ